ncbi:MAG: hypothetical protein K0S74_129 [Chlamydiales bacterium]|jgi:flagellar biosynthesis regulator FlbT|nr:hypothetical protein [Chlamydiales bacterium]
MSSSKKKPIVKQPVPSLQKILKQIFRVFPDPTILALLKNLDEPMTAKNDEECLKILQKNLDYLQCKREVLENHFQLKADDTLEFIQNPDNFPSAVWEELTHIKNSLKEYHQYSADVVQTNSYNKTKKKVENQYFIDSGIINKKRKRRDHWIICD